MNARLRRWYWQRRRKLAAANAWPPLREWLLQPLPRPDTAFDAIDWLVIDIETTGLGGDAHIVSIGWVPIRRARILLGEADHRLVATSRGVGESATIHRITDSAVENATPVDVALQALFVALGGHWPVFHGAALDVAMLDRACRAHFSAPFLPPWTDTLDLERRRRERRGDVIRGGELQLAQARAAYRLPPHAQHHALGDALATAELLCAQVAKGGGKARCGELLAFRT